MRFPFNMCSMKTMQLGTIFIQTKVAQLIKTVLTLNHYSILTALRKVSQVRTPRGLVFHVQSSLNISSGL